MANRGAGPATILAGHRIPGSFLREGKTVLEVLATSVSEISNDKTEEEMTRELKDAIGDDAAFSKLVQDFKDDPDLIRGGALSWLAVAAGDPEKTEAIQCAIEDADRHAPLLEIAAITIMTMYALYLIAPEKKIKEVHKIEQKKDGKFVETTETVYASFSEPLKGAIKLFSGIGKLAS